MKNIQTISVYYHALSRSRFLALLRIFLEIYSGVTNKDGKKLFSFVSDGNCPRPNLFFKSDDFINFKKNPNKSQLRENFHWDCRWYLDSFCIPHVIDSFSRKPRRPYSGSPDCAPTCKIACWLEEACWLPVNRPLSFFINKKCLLYFFWVRLLSLLFLNFLFPNKPDLSYFFFQI